MICPWKYLLLLAVVACQQSRDENRHAYRNESVNSQKNDAACTLTPIPLRRTASGRVIAMGDVHGDLAAAQAALRAARIVGDDGNWIGGDAIVVQTGDILDRGDNEQAIIDWFETLEPQARAAGGAFVWLLGNHEIMNAARDFRYVTAGGFVDFQDVPGLDTAAAIAAGTPQDVAARAVAMAPGGVYARIFAGQNVVAIIGDTVFSHAGITGPWRSQLETINLDTRCWLQAASSKALSTASPATSASDANQPPLAVTAQDGPAWTRAFGGETVDCQALAVTLKALGVARMVVGHTVQAHGISSRCDGALWRIDVGMSAHYGGTPAVLELVASQPPRPIVAPR